MLTALRLATVVRLLAVLAAVVLAGALTVTVMDASPVAAQSDDDDGVGDDDDGVADNDDDDGVDDDDDGTGDDDDGVADNDDDDGDDDDDGSPGTQVRNASRISGANRILTSVAISASQFTTAPTVYLANADGFADALSGGVLTDGPILLVPADGELPAEICAEITRLGPTDVIALGGTLSVSDAVLGQAAAC